ncbi:ECF-type sigma factor [Tahibacter amnicola]|uniref:ECF-type sigma factor n=1 Tax=Tahibacter amnicola TaxID=2976241 RepID=A0ABY6B706_9GAMM|nr:ECF-type sigma factor [Tahibacter amnicola]UXI65883.1 ECF-type sigma factor [Tahibacter amnicola]
MIASHPDASPMPQTPPDSLAANALFAGVYQRLKAMAGRQRYNAGSPATYSTTEIVHELYLRVFNERDLIFERELEFFGYAAKAMRHLLIDLARKRMSLKDGGDIVRIALTDPLASGVSVDPSLALELDAALAVLAADSPRAAQVMELHYFAGLPLARVAELMALSPRTVDRDWQYARAFLMAQLSEQRGQPS